MKIAAHCQPYVTGKRFVCAPPVGRELERGGCGCMNIARMGRRAPKRIGRIVCEIHFAYVENGGNGRVHMCLCLACMRACARVPYGPRGHPEINPQDPEQKKILAIIITVIKTLLK